MPSQTLGWKDLLPHPPRSENMKICKWAKTCRSSSWAVLEKLNGAPIIIIFCCWQHFSKRHLKVLTEFSKNIQMSKKTKRTTFGSLFWSSTQNQLKIHRGVSIISMVEISVLYQFQNLSYCDLCIWGTLVFVLIRL